MPKLADYILNSYNWQCVNAFFALLCFLSSIFGIFLNPVNCWNNKKESSSYCNNLEEGKKIGLIIEEVNHSDKNKQHMEKSYIYEDKCDSSSYLQGIKLSYNGVEVDIPMANFQRIKGQNHSKSTNELVISSPKTLSTEKYYREEISMVKNASFCLTGISKEFYPEKCYSNIAPSEKFSAEILTLCHIKTRLPEKELLCEAKENTIIDQRNKTVLDIPLKEMKSKNSKTYKFNALIRNIFRSSLLQDPSFLGLCISNFLVFMALGIPFAFGPDMMVQKRIMSEENGSNLITPMGITSMIVMPLNGMLIDNGPKFNPILVTALSLMSAGLSMITFIVCKTELEAVIIAIWFGISFSAILSLPAVIVEKLIGDKQMKSAFSVLILLRGISISIGSPIAGKIYDYTNQYDGAFYFGGGLFLFASIPLLVIYLNRQNRYQSQQKG